MKIAFKLEPTSVVGLSRLFHPAEVSSTLMSPSFCPCDFLVTESHLDGFEQILVGLKASFETKEGRRTIYLPIRKML